MEHPENHEDYKGLQVNAGVGSQPITNPYRNMRRARKRELSVNDYVEGIRKGDVSILGRAVTLVESLAESHQAIGSGGDREMSAIFGQFQENRYHGCAGSREIHVDRRIWSSRA